MRALNVKSASTARFFAQVDYLECSELELQVKRTGTGPYELVQFLAGGADANGTVYRDLYPIPGTVVGELNARPPRPTSRRRLIGTPSLPCDRRSEPQFQPRSAVGDP